MFYSVKDANGKVVARLRSNEQCVAFVARVGGENTISNGPTYKGPYGLNANNEWTAY